MECLRLSWESIFLPSLLRATTASLSGIRSVLSAIPSSSSSPLPSQCHRGCLALPPSPPLAPSFSPSLSCLLPPFAASSPSPPPPSRQHSGSCSILQRWLAPPANKAGLHFPSSSATGTHSTRLRSHTQTHTHRSPPHSFARRGAASVWLCLSSALLSPPFFLSVPRVRPPPP